MRAAVGLLAAGALTGCALLPGAPDPLPVPAHFANEAEIAPVRRVMVLPFEAAPGVRADLDMVRAAFAGELAKVQRFEVVPLPDGSHEDGRVYRGLRRGKISPEALADLGKRYNLDGVLVGTVTGYRAYKPPHVGLRVQLLSLHTASAVWAAEAYFDAADAGAVEDVQHYAQSFMAPEESLHGWEMVILSPSRFAAFVCHRLVGTWRDADLEQ